MDNPNSVQDILANLKPSLSKVLLLKNQKGLTPLQVAIEAGGSQIFKMLLQVYKYLDKSTRVLRDVLVMRDNSNMGEPPLIKAVRKDRYDLAVLLLELNKEKQTLLSYDQVLC